MFIHEWMKMPKALREEIITALKLPRLGSSHVEKMNGVTTERSDGMHPSTLAQFSDEIANYLLTKSGKSASITTEQIKINQNEQNTGVTQGQSASQNDSEVQQSQPTRDEGLVGGTFETSTSGRTASDIGIDGENQREVNDVPEGHTPEGLSNDSGEATNDGGEIVEKAPGLLSLGSN